MFRVFGILALTLSAVLFSACGNKHVSYLDNDDVEVLSTEMEEDGDFLIARITFQIDSGPHRQHSAYRIEWWDDDERVIETTPWKALTMRGELIEKVTVRSTVPGATFFKVFISNDSR
ncbi:YcfL family protein [Desulfovibrio sp. OttesenSCG-928-G15]|nr:YcfL family protein [Desulfovibrio sp. OttesenSCG-928-G15]